MIKVAAAIIRKNNKILICQRATDDECSMLWEFPGGKLEPEETLEQCIIREIKEELSLDIRIIDIFTETLYQFAEKVIQLTFFNVEIVGGNLACNVHNEVKWISLDDLQNYPFMPADVDVIQQLCDLYSATD